MHPISSQDESWFPVFDWRFEPTFHQRLKWSFPSAIGMWEGPCVFNLNWNGPWETLSYKKAGFPCSVLNSGSCFISQDEGMSESPLEILEKAIVLCLIWIGGITSLWYLERHMEFKASKGDDAWLFWKWIGIPISLFQLESEPWSPAHLQKRPYCPAKPSLDSWGVNRN